MGRLREAWGALVQKRSSFDNRRMPSNGQYFGGLTQGGIVNNAGAGTSLDKSEGSHFTPTRFYWRSPLEILLVQSGFAAKAIEIPVNDMLEKWRTFDPDADEAAVKAMKEAEMRHDFRARLGQAIKAGNGFGSGLIVINTMFDDPEQPLDVRRVRAGDLKSLNVYDRFDASVTERVSDMTDPRHGMPEYYHVHPTTWGSGSAVSQMYHHSRVIRFDGISPLTMSRWQVYEQDWGASRLIPIIVHLLNDQSIASAIAHLVQEASIPVLSVGGLRDVVGGKLEPNQLSAEEIASTINEVKSNYRMMMLDKESEDFTRVAVVFAGLADLMDKSAARIAAAADIPLTRFLGSSPGGLNATGESDLKNYYQSVASMRERMLPKPLRMLDEVIARDAGLPEPLEYEWPSLLEMSEQEQADVKKTEAEAEFFRAQAWEKWLTQGVADEDEAREHLDKLDEYDLPGVAPGLPEPEPMPGPGGPGPGNGGPKPKANPPPR